MRKCLAVLAALCLEACGGADMTGSWTGTINASGTGGRGDYSDTWNISEIPGQQGQLQILSAQTCTKWGATQSGGLATWATACSNYAFTGTMQLSNGKLDVSFTLSDPNTGGNASANGTLAKQ